MKQSRKSPFGRRPFCGAALALGSAVLAWLGPFSGEGRALDLTAQRTLVNQGVVGMLGDGARGTDFAMIADLATVLDQGYDRRILPMAGAGSVRAVEDLLLLRGVDIALVQADVLDYYKKAELFPDLESKVRYLARLYNKEFHLLTSKDIASIDDLEGKKVNFGPPSSGSFLTASLVFDALGITVDVGDDDYEIGLDKLRQGEIDAWVRVDAKPSLQIESLPSWEGVHLLSLPRIAINATYVPTELTSDDYPDLIQGEDAIETLAVPTIMAVYRWPRRHEKHAQLQQFQGALTKRLNELQRGPFDAKWREVDLTAEIVGWERF